MRTCIQQNMENRQLFGNYCDMISVQVRVLWNVNNYMSTGRIWVPIKGFLITLHIPSEAICGHDIDQSLIHAGKIDQTWSRHDICIYQNSKMFPVKEFFCILYWEYNLKENTVLEMSKYHSWPYVFKKSKWPFFRPDPRTLSSPLSSKREFLWYEFVLLDNANEKISLFVRNCGNRPVTVRTTLSASMSSKKKNLITEIIKHNAHYIEC